MKKLLTLIILILIATSAYCAEPIQLARMSPVMIGSGAGAASCDKSYGYTNISSITAHATINGWVKGGNTATPLQSPASTKTICSLEAYVRSAGGTPGNINIAMYDVVDNAPSTLLCQCAAQVTVSNTDLAWVACASLTGTCSIGASTNYAVYISSDSADVYTGDTYQATGYKIKAVDYTGGFPSGATLWGSMGDSTWATHVRVGLQ